MATFKLRRFASADALKRIRPRILRTLLAPHAPYFAERGIHVNGAAAENGLDYEALAGFLVDPDEGMPQDLIDALFISNEMATEEGMQTLLSTIDRMNPSDRPDLGDTSDVTPCDVAIAVWLHSPDLLEREHAERVVANKKSFLSFLARERPTTPFTPPSRDRIRALERSLGDWFAEKKKSDVVRVLVYPKSDEVWFLVRHGDTFRREGAVKDGQSSSVFYRPEKHDVVVYNPVVGELRVNAVTKGEKDLYRRKFGLHLFGDEDHFPDSLKKYTLEPLQVHGKAALACADVEGIDSIHLTEVTYFWGGAYNEMEIRRASDIFAALEARERELLSNVRISGAKFRVKFSDSKTPRSVNVRPPNVATFTRDDDGKHVEEWLRQREFLVPRPEESGDDDGHSLARA